MKNNAINSLLTLCSIIGLYSCSEKPPTDKKSIVFNSILYWKQSGSSFENYSIGLDSINPAEGKYSAYIESVVSDTNKFGTLYQKISVGEYRGKFVKLSAKIKSQNIEGECGLYFRCDRDSNTIANNSTIHDTSNNDWSNHSIVLKIPDATLTIIYGALLYGKGKLWLDDIKIEVLTDTAGINHDGDYNTYTSNSGSVHDPFEKGTPPPDYKIKDKTVIKPENLNFEEI